MAFRSALTRAAALAAALALLAAPARAEDRVKSKGDVLRGSVTGIEGGKVKLKTVYGGELAIPLADVESVETEGSHHLFIGDDGEIDGPIRGVEDGKLLVGPPDRLERVPFGELHAAYPSSDVEGSTLAMMKARLRYWTASFDLGAGYNDATTDTFTFNQAFKVERKKKPTRFLLGQTYKYGTEKKKSANRTVTVNELKGTVRGEYELTERLFVFANGDGEHNAVQKLSYRLIPSAGLGYKLIKTDDTTFQVEAGGAGVFERFYGGDTNEFPSVVFGAELNQKLPLGAVFNARVDYLPSLEDFVDDYLIKSKATLEVPLMKHVSFKAGVTDDYDNTPAADTDRNSFGTTVAISLSL